MRNFLFKNLKFLISCSLAVSIISIVLGLVIHIAQAGWEEPPDEPPPGGGIEAPLNVSDINQAKKGGLLLGGTTNPGSYILDVRGNAYVSGNILGNQSIGDKDTLWSSLWLKNAGKINFDSDANYLQYNNEYQFNIANASKLTIGASGISVPGGGSNKFRVDVATGSLDINGGDIAVTSTTGGGNQYGKIEGYGTGSLYGVYGETDTASMAGIGGYSITGHGVYGRTSNSGSYGVYGYIDSLSNNLNTAGAGVKGEAVNANGNSDKFSIGVRGIGGSASSFSKNFTSLGVFGSGGDIKNPASGEQKAIGLFGQAGAAQGANAKTYGVYGKEGNEVNSGTSYAGYFEGDVHITGGIFTVTSAFPHEIKSQSLDVVFRGETLAKNSYLDITQGNLSLDVGQHLKLSDGSDSGTDAYLRYTEKCIEIVFNNTLVEQFGTGESGSCKPLCEKRGGYCQTGISCNSGYHQDDRLSCVGSKICCMPGGPYTP